MYHHDIWDELLAYADACAASVGGFSKFLSSLIVLLNRDTDGLQRMSQPKVWRNGTGPLFAKIRRTGVKIDRLGLEYAS